MAADKSYEDKVLEHILAHQREMATLYNDDARRAYQRRVDSVSVQEAYALQIANLNKAAQDAMALRLANQTPPSS